eukprot:GEZU01002511.1.p1 GENE.GEZU01002511.1~~GEZU01002511.1.p1  ORF type:complete len:198 (+),score=37.49 GEZU01002511.1:144-737(+)
MIKVRARKLTGAPVLINANPKLWSFKPILMFANLQFAVGLYGTYFLLFASENSQLAQHSLITKALLSSLMISIPACTTAVAYFGAKRFAKACYFVNPLAQDPSEHKFQFECYTGVFTDKTFTVYKKDITKVKIVDPDQKRPQVYIRARVEGDKSQGKSRVFIMYTKNLHEAQALHNVFAAPDKQIPYGLPAEALPVN